MSSTSTKKSTLIERNKPTQCNPHPTGTKLDTNGLLRFPVSSGYTSRDLLLIVGLRGWTRNWSCVHTTVGAAFESANLIKLSHNAAASNIVNVACVA